jgi:hypothetical protein
LGFHHVEKISRARQTPDVSGQNTISTLLDAHPSCGSLAHDGTSAASAETVLTAIQGTKRHVPTSFQTLPPGKLTGGDSLNFALAAGAALEPDAPPGQTGGIALRKSTVREECK